MCAFVDPLLETAAAPWPESYLETVRAPTLARLDTMVDTMVDAVVVTALSSAHSGVVRTALERGYHEVPDGVYDCRRGEVYHALVGAEPAELRVAGDKPPKRAQVFGE